jgi:putative Holliday junction resolvase
MTVHASRILAVDPGERRIGIAISDETKVVARPLLVLQHRSVSEDASRIVALAKENSADLVLVGVALDAEGVIGPQARKGVRLAEAIRAQSDLRVEPRDESFSTETAASARRAQDTTRRKRVASIDAAAAAAILQEYLDTIGSQT